MYRFLQRHFLTGLLAITPLVITTWILWRFYVLISTTMRPWLQRIPAITDTYPEFLLTFFGVVAFVLLITLVGLFTRNLIGIAFFRVLERFFEQIPVVKGVFSAIKQISEVFLRDRRTAFQKVVLFAYPRQGLYSIGFVTKDEQEHRLVNVFLPTAPNPTSGFMLLVPRQELVELGIPVEEAIKLIVSGGAIMTHAQARLVEESSRRLTGTVETTTPEGIPGKDLEQ
jgi:uncharacterized membrane protein